MFMRLSNPNNAKIMTNYSIYNATEIKNNSLGLIPLSEKYTGYCFSSLLIWIIAIVMLVIGGITQLSAATHQSLRFEKPKVDGEVFNEFVRFAMEDSQGFLWFCTRKGLARYDGYTIKRFVNDDSNTRSISSNLPRSIIEDNNGILWIGTGDGVLNRFDPKSEVFTRYQPESLKQARIEHLFEDSLGFIWLSTNQGLFQLNSKTEVFTHYLPDEENSSSISHKKIWKVIEDVVVKGNLWIATHDGLNYFDRNKQSFSYYTHDPKDVMSINSTTINDIVFASDDTLWIGTNTGISQFNPASNNFTRYFPDEKNIFQRDTDNIITSIYEDRYNQFWIGTLDGGLKLFDRQNKIFVSYNYQPYNPDSLRNDVIQYQGIFEDQRGLLWVLSFDGVNRLNLAAGRFNNYRNDKNNPDSLSGNMIWQIYEDPQEQLWIGTDQNGLNRLDEKEQRFVHYRYDANDNTSISSDRVFSVLVDSEQTLWVGTGKGLNRKEKNSNKFYRYPYDEKSIVGLNSYYIQSLAEDHQGHIWIGAPRGLTKYNKKNKQFTAYVHDPKIPSSLAGRYTTVIFEDRANRLWIGGEGWLDLYDPEKEEFIHFNNGDLPKTSLGHHYITDINQTKDGFLWIAATGGGLSLLNIERREFTHFQEKDGLVSNEILGIVKDHNNRLWLSTAGGLSHFDPETETFRNFDSDDGIQDGEYNSFASVRRANGEIVLGGGLGIDRFFPADLPWNSSVQSIAPAVVLTDFLIFNRSVPLLSKRQFKAADGEHLIELNKHNFFLKNSIAYSPQITLSHHESMFSFEFAALDYLNPNKNQYAYQLQGYDKDWTTTSANKRFATYMNIPAGKYLFKVKASNNDGVWNEQGQTLNVTILPPWWKTDWAYIGYFLLVLLSYYLVDKFRTKALIKRAEQLSIEVKERTTEIERLLEIKNQEFANVSHEFRTPLTLVMGPIKRILSGNIDSTTKQSLGNIVQRNCYRLLRMVDQLIQMEKSHVSQMIARKPLRVKPTVSFIIESFQQLAADKNIHIEQQKIDDVWLFLGTDVLEKIVLNLLSNAIKYTPSEGEIRIRVLEAANNMIEITVSDNGSGIEKHQQQAVFDRFQRVMDEQSENITGAGIGLALVKQLVESNDGTISLTSQLGEGSTFSVFLPQYFPADSDLSSTENSVAEKQEIIKVEIESLRGQQKKLGFDSNQVQFEKSTSEPETVTASAKVLIIEDNQDMLEYIQDILSSHYHCLLATNGKAGFKKALNEVPDLIISDIMMPEMDGYQVCKAIKADHRTSHIPVILLTAKTDRESRLKGWKEQADEYLSKPFDADELLLRTANLLSIRELLSQRLNQGLKDTDDQFLDQFELIELDYGDWISTEQKFLIRFKQFISENINNPNITIPSIALALHMTERQLFRKMKALLNISPGDFLRNRRLEIASAYLKQGRSITEVVDDVGFTSNKNFSRCFKAKYGASPSEYTTLNKS